MKNLLGRLLPMFLMAVLVNACGTLPAAKESAAGPASVYAGKNYVVWISLDGVRGDYVDRMMAGDKGGVEEAAPYLHTLMEHGLYTRKLSPVFPPITFPSHTTEATGVWAGEHGIVGNGFYDEKTGKAYSSPAGPGLLRAEPIWNVATRQGVRTAVLDWPLSQNQRGADAAAVFHTGKFDEKMTDAERAEWVWKVWHENAAGRPVQLLMGYLVATDKPGHQYGPDSAAVTAKMHEVDGLLKLELGRIQADFARWKGPGDALYFLITTDHGMANVTHLVNLDLLLGVKATKVAASGKVDQTASTEATAADGTKVEAIHTGNIANVTLLSPDPALVDALLERVRKESYLTAYRRGKLPQHWHYDAAGRTGDIVIVLKNGYTFSDKINDVMVERTGEMGPKGMHGYPVEDCPEMQGFMVLYRADGGLVKYNLQKVSTMELMPTVARLLRIGVPVGVKGKGVGWGD